MLLARVADRVGLTGALSGVLGDLKRRRRGHDPGLVIRDLAVMIADGGECLSDLGVIRYQQALFGDVCSDSTAFRVIQKLVDTDGMLDALRAAHATARAGFWALAGAPETLTVDLDAPLINSHSKKEMAAWDYKHGFGFHLLQA